MNTDTSAANPPPAPAQPLPPAPPPPASAFVPAVHSSNKVLSILCHLGGVIGLGYFVLPLIVWLVKKDDHDGVAAHAKEALNFHLSVFIYAICCVPLIFLFGLGVLLLWAIGLATFVLGIIAAIKAGDGGFYRYPLTIRIIS